MTDRPAARVGLRKSVALAMAALLALYVVVAGDRAVRFIATGEPLAIVVGVAVVVTFLAGAWALIREVVFGVQLERAVAELEASGGMPAPLPGTPSGRADKDAAEQAFPIAKADVEANPESWASWLRLSMAYDAARDRRRARHAARTSLGLRRQLRRLRKTGRQEAS
ncbi:hypothetical protein ABIB37_000049 [Agrococcus sp. UYP10]|uniref:hypothetical protein n=1 Tax=Agrococcus sp. UYP10 TaxID=1756355 RepID=UPI003394366A